MEFVNCIISTLFAIDWSKTETWSIVTAIATLFTAFVTFLLAVATLAMVKEMKITREKSIVPELIVLPPNYRYEFRWIPLEDLTPIIRPELKEGEINLYETRLPVFGLKNIGKAPALNIEVEWEIKNKSIPSSFSNSEFTKPFKPSFSVQSHMFNLNRITLNGNNGYSVFGIDKEITNIAFSVSTPTTETTQQLSMPSGISGTYDIGLITKEKPDITLGFIDCDNISLTLKYSDLDNKEYRKEFLISSQLLYLPDTIGSHCNSVENKYFSPSNIRGSIRFNIARKTY